MHSLSHTVVENPILTLLLAQTLFVVAIVWLYGNRAIGSSHSTLPGPKGIPVLGNLRQLLPYKADLLGWIRDNEEIYGPLFTFTLPNHGRSIVINHPDWLEHVKKTDMITYGKGDKTLAIVQQFFGHFSQASTEGDAWKANRKVTASLVSIKTFDKQVSRAMAEVIPTAIELLSKVASSGSVIDWNIFASRLSLAMLFRIACSADSGSLTANTGCLEAKNEIIEALYTCGSITASRFTNPLWAHVEPFNGTRRQFRKARAKLWEVADRIIEERLKLKEQGLSNEDDYLSVLLATGLDMQVIRETMVALFFAGQENIVNVFSWSLHELSRNPYWLQRMREEAEANGAAGRVIDYNSVSSYPVHIAVLYETLRLWPGVPKNSRCAKEDDILPGIPSLGYGPVKVSKGDYVVWSDFLMMKRTDVWGEDAEAFNPSRHLDADGKFVKPPQPKFHSFGAGPRFCSGSQLATYEFVEVWAALLPLFDIQPVEMKERKMTNGLTSTMTGDFLITVKHHQQ